MLLQIKSTRKRQNAFLRKYFDTNPRHHQATSCQTKNKHTLQLKNIKSIKKPSIIKNRVRKIFLLSPLILGRPKLELHHVEEASGYQIHANTELEGCRNVNSEEFEIGGAKIVFCFFFAKN